jgi:hypothetical protein
LPTLSGVIGIGKVAEWLRDSFIPGEFLPDIDCTAFKFTDDSPYFVLLLVVGLMVDLLHLHLFSFDKCTPHVILLSFRETEASSAEEQLVEG